MSSESKATTMRNTRRLKKREADRKAQRLARERTKNKITQLEGTVQKLRQTESGAQLSSILDQLSKVTKEKDELLQDLRSMRKMLQRHLEPVRQPNNLRTPSDDTNDFGCNYDLRLDGLTSPNSFSSSTETNASSLAYGAAFTENLNEGEIWYGASQANVPYVSDLTRMENQNHQPAISYDSFVCPESNLASAHGGYWSQTPLVQGHTDPYLQKLQPCTMFSETETMYSGTKPHEIFQGYDI
ncbi:hypothetical protein FSARC_12855 [Fusarium sarcochroum]|uniref:BZIP domain-containing protein n=1 Tax=Fusarium sarcochroum TaxID=1208366 RepID=A0A8H4T5J4_9HYPO|nr:hypothetical protein FSARC_12855 [Fusarium sarcochroum]